VRGCFFWLLSCRCLPTIKSYLPHLGTAAASATSGRRTAMRIEASIVFSDQAAVAPGLVILETPAGHGLWRRQATPTGFIFVVVAGLRSCVRS
jgi:hypothetical protein